MLNLILEYGFFGVIGMYLAFFWWLHRHHRRTKRLPPPIGAPDDYDENYLDESLRKFKNITDVLRGKP